MKQLQSPSFKNEKCSHCLKGCKLYPLRCEFLSQMEIPEISIGCAFQISERSQVISFYQVLLILSCKFLSLSALPTPPPLHLAISIPLTSAFMVLLQTPHASHLGIDNILLSCAHLSLSIYFTLGSVFINQIFIKLLPTH